MKVSNSTNEDLASILSWLEAEYEKDHEGFWCNRSIIENSHVRGDLYVVKEESSVVGFQVGRFSADILCVRQENQKTGVGTALLYASLKRAEYENVIALAVECNPPTSLPFWQKHGFERLGEVSEIGPITARRILDRQFELSADSEKVEVTICFYPERAKYDGRGSVEPISSHHVIGEWNGRSIVFLERRVAEIDGPSHGVGDLVIYVQCGDRQLYFDKAKYEKAEALGVLRSSQGGGFFIDVLKLEHDSRGALVS